MTASSHPRLAAHLRLHARRLHRIACGLGRQRDADDILQTLYTRWWRRMNLEPGWAPPESSTELFVCVRRVVIDVVAKEKRERARDDRSAGFAPISADSPEESLHAFERLQWILDRLPFTLAEALMASLSAGRRTDAAVARELGITACAYTMRLFKARRAAEELARFHELLAPQQADLLAALTYGGKSRAQLAHEHGLLGDELGARVDHALAVLEKSGKAAAS